MTGPVLSPIPENYPNPDCPHCLGVGVPPSRLHALLGDDDANEACAYCHEEDDDDEQGAD